MGCDRLRVVVLAALVISIHAPQWGATVDSRRFRVQYGRFQSTHPSGVRHEAGEVVVLGGGISIHAPQWGATKYPKAFVKVALDFNPRTPVGCDGGSETVDSGRDEFQSTHPSGVRHLEGRRHSHPIDFNPRTPVGCDLSPPLIRRCRRYFNPRTPVGCDLRLTEQRERTITYFNPRTPVGCDCSISAGRSRFGYFNPRTPVGCDSIMRAIYIRRLDFNPRTPVGCDRPWATNNNPSRDFNPRTPVGCDALRVYHAVAGLGISIHAPQWGATGRVACNDR